MLWATGIDRSRWIDSEERHLFTSKYNSSLFKNMKFWKNHFCRQSVFLYFIKVMEKGNANQVRQIDLEIDIIFVRFRPSLLAFWSSFYYELSSPENFSFLFQLRVSPRALTRRKSQMTPVRTRTRLRRTNLRNRKRRRPDQKRRNLKRKQRQRKRQRRRRKTNCEHFNSFCDLFKN